MTRLKTQQGRTALITGASSGIGKAMAVEHAKDGGDLVLVARRKDRLDTIASEIRERYGVNVRVLSHDLTEPESRRQIHATLKDEGIQIDYLINNAGFGGQGYFHKREWSEDANMIELNIVALTELTRLFLPDFVARNAGRILNVSSTASFMPGPLQAVYFATKAYVTSFSHALVGELTDTEVTVTVLSPGATATEFADVSDMQDTALFAKTATAESVASTGYQAMLRGDLNVIAGMSLPQKLMMKAIPFVPTRMLLDNVKKLQSRDSS